MNYARIGKTFQNKIRSKKLKNQKKPMWNCRMWTKTTTEKANFCSNTNFSLYFKFRAKKFHAAKPLAFSLHFLFRLNYYSNLTSKIMKMCEQILKKTWQDKSWNTIQRIEWKNIDVLYQQINWAMPARTETKSSQILEKLKESKQNKNIFIAKALEAFKPKAKFFPLKIHISKLSFKPIFVSEIDPVLYLQDLKNIHWTLKID